MLIRTTKRGSTLPNYLWKSFCQLLLSIISMTTISEQIRKRIQNCSEINYLEMVQFFKSRLKSENYLWKFCNMNSEDQYDFTSYDVKYLSNHVRSGNMLRNMTDEDIKQLICPLDMNFQKTVHEMAPYYQNLKMQKQKTMNGFFFQQTKNDQIARQTTTTNFLKSTYQPFFTNPRTHKQNTSFQPNTMKPTSDRNPNNKSPKKWVHIQPLNIKPVVQADDMILKPSRLLEGSQMYLDNFIKPVSYDNDRYGGQGYGRPSNDYRGISGNNNNRGNYIGGGAYGYVRDSYQKFDDPLPQNLSSEHSNSAFVQY